MDISHIMDKFSKPIKLCNDCIKSPATMMIRVGIVKHWLCDNCAQRLQSQIRDEFEIRDKVVQP